MKNWNGKEILTARSKGGVLAVANPLDNLISTNIVPWPTAEIVQKLYQSRQESAFSGENLVIVKSVLGYYSDLQSLHSEDAITWSVFGTASRAPHVERERWISDLFKILDIQGASSLQSDFFLWQRIPHPDTFVPGGPEIDFGIITSNAIVLGEAKWQSGVGKRQGKEKDKDQIQLRGEFLKYYGSRILESCTVQVVVGISLLPDAFTNTVPKGILFRNITWDDICRLSSHLHAEELKRYLEWKKQNTR
jgi:hypothetical protein